MCGDVKDTNGFMKGEGSSLSPEECLKVLSEEFKREMLKVTDNVYFAIGFGASNCILIEGKNGSVLIDALESVERAEDLKSEFQKISQKPIRAIIYTHSHKDHVGGASVFRGDHTEIISRKPFGGLLGPNAVSAILGKRANRQFGVALSPEEGLNNGISMNYDSDGKNGFVLPTRQFSDEKLTLVIEGIHLELISAPGETDDQLLVWLPDQKVLISADNYYKSFPNLYAIRGTPYRDIDIWVKTLDNMLRLNAQYLLPGHSRPIIGQENIREVLTDYRNAIDYVLQETLRLMNQGLTPDELANAVKLPPNLSEKPYLQEFYGTVQWSVRSIFTGYLGWFDGNPTNLNPLAPKAEAKHMAGLAGGSEILYKEAQNALIREDYQWAMQLSDYLIVLEEFLPEANLIKSQACRALARKQTSACGRNYYFSYAREIENKLNN